MGVAVLGLMSGTSLDGLDLALVEFSQRGLTVDWKFIKTDTIEYSSEMIQRLENAPSLSGLELTRLDVDYGRFLGEASKLFIDSSSVKPQIIASHGHTIFHEPKDGFTRQIGDGNYVAAVAGVDTIVDFRSLDMAVGGQGAPLVPIGDELLFSNYTSCLNLGGIANISSVQSIEKKAFDICPFNLLLNNFSQAEGKPYDENGELAKQGQIHDALLNSLNSHSYYSQYAPKSLDKEWLMKEFIPLIDQYGLSNVDILRTLVEHFAQQIVKNVPMGPMLVTGGGTHNSFFIEQLGSELSGPLEIPEKELIDFKEALIFALLGYLRLTNQNNTIPTATGAAFPVCSGTLIKAPKHE